MLLRHSVLLSITICTYCERIVPYGDRLVTRSESVRERHQFLDGLALETLRLLVSNDRQDLLLLLLALLRLVGVVLLLQLHVDDVLHDVEAQLDRVIRLAL